jgi:hypothetical protein
MNARPVPSALARRGLRVMTDNLSPGASLRFEPGDFLRLFRSELETRLGLVRRSVGAEFQRKPQP